jgi:hypothetical protein
MSGRSIASQRPWQMVHSGRERRTTLFWLNRFRRLIKRLDNVSVVVDDLAAAINFFPFARPRLKIRAKPASLQMNEARGNNRRLSWRQRKKLCRSALSFPP